jgi:phospholipase C
MKASVTQTGHASDSSPLAEQQFPVATINRLERLPQWPEMAILHNLWRSDGWYNHVMPPIVSKSNDPVNDALLGSVGLCSIPAPGGYKDRRGYGPRLPFSPFRPFAKSNFVDNSLADQSSVLRFIEDNWQTECIADRGARKSPSL